MRFTVIVIEKKKKEHKLQVIVTHQKRSITGRHFFPINVLLCHGEITEKWQTLTKEIFLGILTWETIPPLT